jgi:hypothetical protein
MNTLPTNMTTWRTEFDQARKGHSYGLLGIDTTTRDDSPVVAVAPNESVLDIPFDGGFGSSSGPPVLIWTEERVYFPVTYDGSESLGSAPRNPTSEGQSHVGGE